MADTLVELVPPVESDLVSGVAITAGTFAFLVGIASCMIDKRHAILSIGYVACTAALSSMAVSWYMAFNTMWFVSIAAIIATLCFIEVYGLSTSAFMSESLKAMPTNTVCCLRCLSWSDPLGVQWYTCALRVVCGLCAIVACYISWLDQHNFAEKQYAAISWSWGIVSCAWFLSCIPCIVCLLQCASISKSAHEPSTFITILKFRKTIAMWLVHDLMLGTFWLYLSFMLYDLSDDEDDSEWRTIFLSMLSWHIVVVVLQQLYFQKMWSVSRPTPHKSYPPTCCSPETMPAWLKFVNIAAFVSVYAVLMGRMRRTTLTEMGCSLEELALFVIAICTGCLSKLGKSQSVTVEQSGAGDKFTRTTNQMGLHF